MIAHEDPLFLVGVEAVIFWRQRGWETGAKELLRIFQDEGCGDGVVERVVTFIETLQEP